MKFFFAENCDSVDPNFDFVRDQPTPGRNRSKDLFPHELLDAAPYDGLLASRALIEGNASAKRYSQAQKYRVLREGLRSHFRFPSEDFQGDPFDFPIMGDCGSFSYVDERTPPYAAQDTLEFYLATGVQYGVAPDHIILDYNLQWDRPRLLPAAVAERLRFTRNEAAKFLEFSREHAETFVPIGPIQCWSPASAAREAERLVRLGYRYLGLGGLVSRRTHQIFDMVSEIRANIPAEIKLHLFGFSRIDELESFSNLGIDSFDTTSPMLKAFKDDELNYFSASGDHLTALRLPARDDAKVKARIKSGHLEDSEVRQLEEDAMRKVRAYDEGKATESNAVEAIHAYENLIRPHVDLRETYLRTLERADWKTCPCRICQEIGIEIILHRNLNRHKRRGAHNLYILYEKVKKLRDMNTITLPCLRITQSEGRHIYSFAVDGKDIQKFASISRIARSTKGDLEGYQRPEIMSHIDDIRNYLELPHAVLPNALIIAFNEKLHFKPTVESKGATSVGEIRIPLGGDSKAGWVVDGQQRLAALRQMTKRSITVPVTAIESDGVGDEREQFVLINNTRPLPKSLVYELLPSLGESVPPKYRRRQAAYHVLELLATDPDSPFYQRIKTTTAIHYPGANIKDVSVLRMIENSVDNGILARYPQTPKPQARVLLQYWTAVKEVFPEAWELPPRESRLTHGAGIIGMGFLMDAIAFRLKQSDQKLATHCFRRELQQIEAEFAWTEGSWNLAPGVSIPWKEIQNTGRHIDLLTNFLIRHYRASHAHGVSPT